MITGIYKFYQDGKLIGESENNITELGRVLAIKTILGAVPSFGTSIQVGVGQAPNLFSYAPTRVVVGTGTTTKLVTMTVSSHNLSVGNTILINGITTTGLVNLNKTTQTITEVSTTEVKFLATQTLTSGTYNKSYTPTSISIAGTAPAQVITATIGTHQLPVGTVVSITGITTTAITSLNNKSFTVTAVGGTTISFIHTTSVTGGPYSSPGGSITHNPFLTFGQLATNKNLDFKVASAPVISSYLSNTTSYDGLVFKAKVDDPSSYRINEVALFSDSLLSGATNYKTENLVSFDASENIELSGISTVIEYVTGDTSPRIGDTALSLISGTANEVIVNSSFSNLDSFTNTDLIKIAFNIPSSSSAILTTTFYSTGGSTMTYYHIGTNGYNVVPVTISNGTVSGSFEWSNITSIKFSSNANIILDGVKFERSSIEDTNNGMVSRTVLTTPIYKASNVPVDIEYYLRLGFN